MKTILILITALLLLSLADVGIVNAQQPACLPGQVCTFPLDSKGTNCNFNEQHFFTIKGDSWVFSPNQKTSLSEYFGDFDRQEGYLLAGDYYGGCVCDTATWVNYVLAVNGFTTSPDANYHNSYPIASTPKEFFVTICIECENGTFDLWVHNNSAESRTLRWRVNEAENTVSLWVENPQSKPVVTILQASEPQVKVSEFNQTQAQSLPDSPSKPVIASIGIICIAVFALGVLSKETRNITLAIAALTILIIVMFYFSKKLNFTPITIEDYGQSSSEEFYTTPKLAYSPQLRTEDSVPEPTATPPTERIVNLDGFEEIFSGVYLRNSSGVSIIRTDLGNPSVKYFTSSGDQTQTVCGQRERYGLQVAINGSGFDMASGLVQPFAMFEGNIYSSSKTPDITLFVTNDNRLIFGHGGTIPEGARYAITGFNRVVENGQVLDRFYPGQPNHKPGYDYFKRRTTVSTDGQFLNIVLFDTPLTIAAIGEYHLATFPGVTDVFNLDGGGSTNSCIEGIGPTVQETGRPVANVFGFYADQ